MAGLRYIVPALAAAAGAAAQSCGGGSGTTTIQSNADATALASCTTYEGSIAIASDTTDSIQLNGIQSITGNLVVTNVTQMTSLAANDLEEIGEMFELEQLTILSTLNFPSLKKVDAIKWTALPALQGLSFTQGVEEVGSVLIDNTELNSLDGINLQVVDELSVTNNPYLTDITMQLGNVTRSFLLASNGRDLKVELPNLEWANNITFRNVSTVIIPSLASINGSMGFYNGGFESLAAPNLTNVGGSLSFVSCEAVTNISMPQLTTIGGGFQLANNTDLKDISGFPAMETVGGALDFNGEYDTVELPELSDVRGAFNLQSTEDINNVCSHFKPLSGQNNVIKGTFTCSTTETPGGVGTSTSSGSGGSTSSGAANPMLIPGATGLLGVLAALFGLL